MTNNPYSPPKAAVADINTTTEFQSVKLWSASGRIGRLRYLAYSMVAYFAVAISAGLLVALLGPQFAIGIVAIAYIAFLVFIAMKLIQRSHDMNWSGWTCLLAFIPLVGLIWVFRAGTEGENNYGAPPPSNTTAIKVLGIGAPFVAFMLGILAAIAIPAYQQYVQRAKAAQHSQPTHSN
jgi:uncharacterized membrane protein YhaH (DUF805 family)